MLRSLFTNVAWMAWPCCRVYVPMLHHCLHMLQSMFIDVAQVSFACCRIIFHVWFAFCCSSEASLTGGRSLQPETGATRAGGRHPRWSSCGGEGRCSPWPRTSLLVDGRRSCEWRPRKAATGSSVCCKCMFGVFLRFRKNIASVSYLCCKSRSWCCKNWYRCCNVAKVDLDVADVVFKCCVCCFLMLWNFLSMLWRDGLMLRRDLDFFSSATVFDLTSTIPRSGGCACVRFFPLLQTSGR
jgi:hypothetical protein